MVGVFLVIMLLMAEVTEKVRGFSGVRGNFKLVVAIMAACVVLQAGHGWEHTTETHELAGVRTVGSHTDGDSA